MLTDIDIVDRLRCAAQTLRADVCNVAADEIEALRRELGRVRRQLEEVNFELITTHHKHVDAVRRRYE